jgi:hypothetical protein
VELNRLLDDLEAAGAAVRGPGPHQRGAPRGQRRRVSRVSRRPGAGTQWRGARSGRRSRAGDSCFWAATELFDRAQRTRHEPSRRRWRRRRRLPPPQPAPPVAKRDISSASVERPAPPAPPSAGPPPSDKPPQAALPATPVPATRDRLTRAATRERLTSTRFRRHCGATLTRTAAATRPRSRRCCRHSPSSRLRGLEKDFSDYRSYSVDIAESAHRG